MTSIVLILCFIMIFPKSFGEHVVAPIYKGFLKGMEK